LGEDVGFWGGAEVVDLEVDGGVVEGAGAVEGEAFVVGDGVNEGEFGGFEGVGVEFLFYFGEYLISDGAEFERDAFVEVFGGFAGEAGEGGAVFLGHVAAG